jgi:hypothetical protein
MHRGVLADECRLEYTLHDLARIGPSDQEWRVVDLTAQRARRRAFARSAQSGLLRARSIPVWTVRSNVEEAVDFAPCGLREPRGTQVCTT